MWSIDFHGVFWVDDGIENHAKTIVNQSWTVNPFDLKSKSGPNAHLDDMEDSDHFQEWAIRLDSSIWFIEINYLIIEILRFIN